MRKRLANIILLTSVLFLSGFPSDARALDSDDSTKCIKREDHDQVTVLLVDRTDKSDDVRLRSFNQSVHAIKEMLQPGERFVVALSTGKATDTRMVLDLVKPKGTLWDSKMKVRAREKEFYDCVDSVAQNLATHPEEYKTSAIIETLGFVSKVLANGRPDAKKRVVLFSDMIENGPTLSFIKGESIDTKKSIETLKKEKLIYDFKDVPIYAAGVGQGASDKKVGQLEQFWTAYFTEAGGALKFFGPIFLGP